MAATDALEIELLVDVVEEADTVLAGGGGVAELEVETPGVTPCGRGLAVTRVRNRHSSILLM